MERFDSIYLFTTENISGYMNDIDLTGKKIVTVTGSTDHIINAILMGANEILTFDINPLAKYYMDLKLAAILKLSLKDFLDFLLYDTDKSFDYNIINNLDMDLESKRFWLNKLEENNKDGLKLKYSGLFNIKYFDFQNKIDNNLYLKKESYDIIKSRLVNVKINFVSTNIVDLKLTKKYDYMFLSNVSDYINTFFKDNYLLNYKKLIDKFLRNVNIIYFILKIKIFYIK